MSSPNVVIQNVDNTVFAEALLFGTLNNPDDVPFAGAQDLNHSHTMQLSELQGPESRTAIGVGVKGEEITLSTKFAVVDPRQIELARGISQDVLAAVSDPTVACVPTAAGTDGSFGIGFAAVGYAFRRIDGTTKIGGIATVDLADTKHIAIAAITPLPTDVVSVDWYVTRDVGVDADAALLLPLFFSKNNDGSALTVKDPPGAGARAVPAFSHVGTTMTQVDIGSNDQIKAFDLKMEASLDGSAMKRMYYNCVVTKAGDAIAGPREWVMGDFECKCYGKPNPNGDGTFIYYSTFYSGDRTG